MQAATAADAAWSEWGAEMQGSGGFTQSQASSQVILLPALIASHVAATNIHPNCWFTCCTTEACFSELLYSCMRYVSEIYDLFVPQHVD